MDLPNKHDKSLALDRSARRESLRGFFSEDECGRLDVARESVSVKRAVIVYCVYENPFAKSGGIFVVADNYCSALKAAGRQVTVLTPLHSRLRTAPDELALRRVGSCRVRFGGQMTNVELFEHVFNNVRWILLRAAGFFEADGGSGGTDPYVDADPTRLLTDSLFVSAAVPEVMAALGETENLIFHLQDWELASAALSVKVALLEGRLKSAVVVLTSHNPYDHELLPEFLRLMTSRVCQQTPPPTTVYQQMLPLTDGPISTVSQTFAHELLTDPLQTQHFAGHLGDILRHCGIVGVDNGLFGRPHTAYTDKAIRDLANGSPEVILDEKLAKRKKMLQVLSDYADDRIVGHLHGDNGRPLVELPDSVPVFLMFGRMDPGQKGFDVLSRAIEALPPGQSRFILTPILSSGSSPYRDDLFRLAELRPGEVAIYPFRMERGYMEAMAGASYAVMPSLYEPFGGATEPYLLGTPVVARATGGLIQQVADIDSNPDAATGILFREALQGNGQQWSALQTAETPAARMQVAMYRAIVDALVVALSRAGEIFESAPTMYAKMLGHLFEQAQSFSWERAIQQYTAVYELAASRDQHE